MRWLDGITDWMDVRLGELRVPPQLEKRYVVPPSSQDEALARYSVYRSDSATPWTGAHQAPLSMGIL